MKNLKSFSPLFLGFFLFSLYMLCDLESWAGDSRFLPKKEKEKIAPVSRFLVRNVPVEVSENKKSRFLEKKVKTEVETPEFIYPAALNLYDWAEIFKFQKTTEMLGTVQTALKSPLENQKEKLKTPSVFEVKFVPAKTNAWEFSSHQLDVLEAWAVDNGKYLLIERVEGKYDSWIQELAEAYKVDADLMTAICVHESGGDPTALSCAGAIGLMQLMPITCRHYDILDPWDPYQNLEGSAKVLADLPNWGFYTLPDMILAYGRGVSKARRYLDRGGQSLNDRGVREVLFLYDAIRKED